MVANHADSTVSKIDPRSPAHVVAGIPVGRGPNSIVVAAPSAVWVANVTDGTVMQIDGSRDRVVKTVSLANPPQGIAVSSDSLYVSVRSSGREHRGGTLRVVGAPPDFIDPALAYASQSWAVLAMTNDGLVGFRKVGGIEGVQLVPDLAAALPTPTIRQDVHLPTPGRCSVLDRPIRARRGLPRGDRARLRAREAPVAWPRLLLGHHRHRTLPAWAALRLGTRDRHRRRQANSHVPSQSPGRGLPNQARAALGGRRAVESRARRRPSGRCDGAHMVAEYRKNGFLRLVRNPMFRAWSADAQPDGYPDAITWKFTTTLDRLPGAS